MLQEYKSHKIVKAEPMMRKEAERIGLVRDIKPNDIGDEEGYKVVYSDSYISWSPKKTFEDGYSLEVSIGKNQKTSTEEMIKAKGLTAPRVTKELIASRIKNVTYTEVPTPSGSMLRFCMIEMINGFVVTGEPSASVSPENDDAEIGMKIAYENAYRNIWALEGYLLAEQLRD